MQSDDYESKTWICTKKAGYGQKKQDIIKATTERAFR
jgi:hypothetical protein